MKSRMSFPARGGCYTREGDALLPHVQREAIAAPADGSVVELTADAEDAAQPTLPPISEDAYPAEATALPSNETPTPTRRRRRS